MYIFKGRKCKDFKSSLASYNGKTSLGKLKIKCFNHKKMRDPCSIKDIYLGNEHKFPFICDVCGHDFPIAPTKIKINRWCPYCSKPPQKLCHNFNCDHCFNKSFASSKFNNNWNLKLNKLQYYFDNLKLPTKINKKKLLHYLPRMIFKNTGKPYWLHCNLCNHDIKKRIADLENIDKKTDKTIGCSYCTDNSMNRKLCSNLNCEICVEYRFINNNLSYLYNKNNKEHINTIFLKSHQKYYFNCKKCKKKIKNKIRISDITCQKKKILCICCGTKKICNDIKCFKCHNKSLDSYMGKTPNGNFKKDYLIDAKPRQIFKKASSKKYNFKCDNCTHKFKKLPCQLQDGRGWCPYCANPSKKFCEKYKKNYNKKDCIECWEKSFDSFIGKTPNGNFKKDLLIDVDPKKLFKHESKKYDFKCDNCNTQFKVSINSVTRQWCGNCKNKTELHFFTFLNNNKEKFNILEIQREFKPEWFEYTTCINNNIIKKYFNYRYDFKITFKNDTVKIFEIDGEQHSNYIKFFDNSKNKNKYMFILKNQLRDKYKEFIAKKKGIQVIRILQKDIWFNKNNWEQYVYKHCVI